MIDVVAWVLVAACLALALWGVVGSVRAARPAGPQLLGMAVLEVALLVQAVVAGVRLVGGADVPSTGTVVAYLVVSVIVLPAGALWGIADRSRWGNGVIAVSCLTAAVLVVRLVQVWGG
ncbi:MAG TPA: hypothetical protein VFD41_04760 [Actinomycetales bacterium]|nr:hypothetical protein [Actinomycetales bacterium]